MACCTLQHLHGDSYIRNVRVEDLRFNLPVAVDPYNGTYDATSYGPACPQQSVHLLEWPGVPVETQNLLSSSIFQAVLPSSEDCESYEFHTVISALLRTFEGLSVNVVVPSGTDTNAELPVVVVSDPCLLPACRELIDISVDLWR